MSGTFLPVPVFRAVDANGAPLPGALLQFYVTGTTTPATAYSSASLGTALANPVAADAGGLFVPIYLDPTVAYRCQLQTSAGALIRDIDPVAAPLTLPGNSVTAAMLQAGVAAANLGYTPVNKAGDTATNLLLSITSPSLASAGLLVCPVNEQDANYTFLASDVGKMVGANIASAIAYTIAAGYLLLGAPILVRNAATSTANITITRGTGVTLYGAGGTTNKDWALAPGGLATLIGEGTNTLVVAGTGLS